MTQAQWATQVKANAGWICQECGSSEQLEAHDPTHRHINVDDGVCLCSKCHGRTRCLDHTSRVSLYLPPEEYELLRKRAYDQRVKMNDVARQLIQSISGHAVVVQKAA